SDKTKEIISPTEVNFRQVALDYLLNVLHIQQSNIPSCIVTPGNESWWVVTAYPGLPGTFSRPDYTYQIGTCPNCRLYMKKPVVVQNHPWLASLNSYLDDMWGMTISSQTEVPALSMDKSECNKWDDSQFHQHINPNNPLDVLTMNKFNHANSMGFYDELNDNEGYYVVNVQNANSRCTNSVNSSGQTQLQLNSPNVFQQIKNRNEILKSQLTLRDVNNCSADELAFDVGNSLNSDVLDVKNQHLKGRITTGNIERYNEPQALFYRKTVKVGNTFPTTDWVYMGGIQIQFPYSANSNNPNARKKVFSTSLFPLANTWDTRWSWGPFSGGSHGSELIGLQEYVSIDDLSRHRELSMMRDVKFKSVKEFDHYLPTSTKKYTNIIGEFKEDENGFLVFRRRYQASISNLPTTVWYEDVTIHSIRFYRTEVSELKDCDITQLCVPFSNCLACVKWNNTPQHPTINPDDLKKVVRNAMPMTCKELQIESIKEKIANQYNEIVKSVRTKLELAYKTGCDINNVEDNLKLKYTTRNYHYTLYYYDRAGNLVRTIPPKGVKIDATRRRTSGNPVHNMASMYDYNTSAELVKQTTPDGGTSKFWYNSKHQIKYSQTSRQAAGQSTSFTNGVPTVSYIKYDDLGRIVETGEMQMSSMGSDNTAINDNMELGMFPWNNISRKRISLLTYGTYSSSVTLPAPYNANVLDNTNKRIIETVFDEDGDLTTTTDKTSMWYSYDVHGNVQWVIHEVPSSVNGNGSIVAKTEYRYDLVSGNVKRISYRTGFPDQYFRRFTYDRDNRLKMVETSRDTVIWDKDVSYEYYPHGPLRRAAFGEDSVQAVDYVYTIQGWLKGINHSSLDPNKDPGGDGNLISNEKTRFPKDAFGMALGYFAGDFDRYYNNGSTTKYSSFNTTTVPKPENLNSPYPLYNGNISSWVTNTQPSGLTGNNQPMFEGITGNLYRYDVLNRLKSEWFKVYDVGATPWETSNGNYTYNADYSYDANGNIVWLRRKATRGRDNNGLPIVGWMDNFTYTYNNPLTNNRLHKVDDNAANDAQFTNAGDIKNVNIAGDHYEYYNDGSLKKDNRENITDIRWSPGSKVETITKGNGDVISILYDGAGHRVRKKVATTALTKTTYYVYGAFGMQEALYEQTATGNKTLKEISVYGGQDFTAPPMDPVKIGKLLEDTKDITTHVPTEKIPLARMGLVTPANLNYSNSAISTTNYTFSRVVNQKVYELKDHLGNIRAVVGDVKDPAAGGTFIAQLKSYMNYYGFGMAQPERNFSSSNYRYGYNGQEKDDEIQGAGNSYSALFWQYDSRLLRRWNLEPKPGASLGAYTCFGNNPILYRDTFGDSIAEYNENGIFVRHLPDGKDVWSGRIVQNTNKGSVTLYSFTFNDGLNDEDLGLIRKGANIIIRKQSDIVKALDKSGVWSNEAQERPTVYIERESRPAGNKSIFSGISSGKMDYYGSTLTENVFYLVVPIKVGFPAIAYNPRDFGNFLWGSGGHALGFSFATLLQGAWANNLFNQHSDNPNTPWYRWRPWDDPADTRAIHAGYCYPYPTPPNNFTKQIPFDPATDCAK
ncbi:MAG: hypothetical protein JNJ85_07035, partial [Candidatus Kapabacteria bacterium]|nr:hypothetical protein [Candidatus Kapabacteria bacterium]